MIYVNGTFQYYEPKKCDLIFKERSDYKNGNALVVHPFSLNHII
jgi:hypothetical protein